MDSWSSSNSSSERQPKKLLVNVKIENSLGTIQVLMSPENTARDLVQAAICVYVKEKRRPLLGTTDPASYDLHYSQFSFESLKPDEKLVELGSRNFFLCSRRPHGNAH